MPFLNFEQLNPLQRQVAQKLFATNHPGEAPEAWRWRVTEQGTLCDSEPERRPATEVYDPAYGDDRLCECGHPYHRHFNIHDGCYEIYGCKYCQCYEFKEKTE